MSGEKSLFGDEDPALDPRSQRRERVQPVNWEQDDLDADPPVSLPHWSEPPTGEIPRVIVELSGDHPSWLETKNAPASPRPMEDDLQLGARHAVTSGRHSVERSAGVGERSARAPEDDAGWAAQGRDPKVESDASAEAAPTSRSGKQAEKTGRLSSRRAGFAFPASTRLAGRRRVTGGDSSERKGPSAKRATRTAVPESSADEQSGQGSPPRGRSKVQSTVTGLVLGAIVIVGVLLGPSVAEVLFLIALVFATGEYYSSLRKFHIKPATLVGLVAVVLCVLGGYLRGFSGIIDGLVVGVLITMIWYLSGLIRTTVLEGMATTILGIVWIGLLGSFASLILRRADFGSQGTRLLLATLVVTSAADVFAYFGGQYFGKRKLAPHLSPSKTYEGLACGFVAAVVAGALISGHLGPLSMGDGLLLGIVGGIVTPLGDLCESMIKRSLDIKDASRILPGHGGVLDRIDGVLFMLPIAYFIFRLLKLA
ncbi:MAG: phosphatidate cytidylyltransferase [Acidimicrobiales bacterium]